MFPRGNREFLDSLQRQSTMLTTVNIWTSSKSLPTYPNNSMTNRHGSGFTLERITKFKFCIAQYRPLHGSCYIATPPWLSNKRAVINVKNTSDSKCFVWSILAALHPGAHNSDRLSNYKPHENTLNTSGLTFPMPIKDTPYLKNKTPPSVLMYSVAVMRLVSFLCTSVRNVTAFITSTCS